MMSPGFNLRGKTLARHLSLKSGPYNTDETKSNK